MLLRRRLLSSTKVPSPFPKTELPPEFAERWARFHPTSAALAKPAPAAVDAPPSEPTLVFMDMECKRLGSAEYAPLGRVVFSLFTHHAPKTSENFRQLCLGNSERKVCARGDNIPLHYLHSPVHRVIPGFLVQGGDFQLRNGFGGESVYGPRFADESFERKHDEALLLGMANVGPNTNASQFYVTLQPAPWLDGLNVVFGRVIKGANVIKAIEQLGGSGDDEENNNGRLAGGKVRVARCGQLAQPDSDVETDVRVRSEAERKREAQDAEVVVEEQDKAKEEEAATAPTTAA